MSKSPSRNSKCFINNTSSEECFDILNNAPIGIFTSTPQGRYLSVNPALVKMYGYDSAQELIDSITDIASQVYAVPAEREHFKAMLDIHGQVHNYQCRLLRRDGTRFWASMNVRTVRAQNEDTVIYQGFTTDITDYKMAEKDVQDRNRLLQDISDNMFDMVSLADRQGVFKFVSASHRVLGYDPEQFPGRHILEFVHPDDLPQVSRAFEEFNSGRNPNPKIEYRYRCADGSYLWLETVARVINNQDGNPGDILFSSRDMTERKSFEERLSKSEGLMRGLYDNIPSAAAIYEVRGDGSRGSDYIVKDFNTVSLAIEGKTREEVVGRSLADLRPNIDDYGLIPVFRNVWLTGKPAVFPAKVYSDDHYFNWYENRIFKTPTGEIVAIYDDVTEKMQAEEKLREKQMLLQGILDNIPDIMSVKRPDLSMILYNKAGYDFVNMTPKTVKGRKCFELIGRKIPCHPCATLEAVRQGKMTALEKYQPELDIHLSCRAKPIINQDGQVEYIVELIRDITERKKAEQHIQEINRQLKEVNTDQNRLLKIIAHDLKSPLSGILSASDILARDMLNLSKEDIATVAKDISASIRNITELLDDLLEWSRMRQGSIEFSPKHLNLYELVNANLRMAGDTARNKKIQITADIPAHLAVMADASMLNTIIRNLLFNALKFTPDGGIIAIKAHLKENMATLAVQDNGIGMNEEVLSRVFTVENAKRQLGTSGEKGTGLGLMLCQELVRQHGGDIWIESEPGQGTVVYFSLPVSS